jgi:predicted glutamine amidotransferase
MCRMIAAPTGLFGQLLVDGFLRMSQGRNALNELNTGFGKITHADGWGAVFVDGEEVRVHRSVAPCWRDPSIEPLRDKSVLLLHARRASKGSVTLDNVHPFEQEIGGERWFFCHNGTVRGELPITETLTKADPTDSERLFHLLRPYIAAGDVLAGIREVCGGISDFTCLNSFLLGPDALWVVCLHTEHPVYYTMTLATTEHGPIVSSEPLGELGPTSFSLPNGSLLHIDRRTGTIDTYTLE